VNITDQNEGGSNVPKTPTVVDTQYTQAAADIDREEAAAAAAEKAKTEAP